jgi:hypothetical protein
LRTPGRAPGTDDIGRDAEQSRRGKESVGFAVPELEQHVLEANWLSGVALTRRIEMNWQRNWRPIGFVALCLSMRQI